MFRTLYLWACDRLYHELAPAYDRVSRLVSFGAWPAWRRAVLPHLRGPHVLELGFGTGELLAELCAPAPFGPGGQDEDGALPPPLAFWGLERSSEMHAVSSRGLAREGADPPRVQATAEEMPFAAAAFNTVVATFPAPYILAPATLAECARVLQPHGRLVIAGLWVRLRDPHLRPFVPIFYADPPQVYADQVAARVAAAGFRTEWCLEPAGWAEVPILVAELP